MKLTQQRQLEQEQTIDASIPRIAIIDAAVGQLQVQVADLTARLDDYDEVMVAVNKLFTEMLDMLKSITENADE